MERHGYALVTYIDKRCFSAGSNAEDVDIDAFVKAYEFLHQQMALAMLSLSSGNT